MFQSCGWDNEVWIGRLKKIGCWWVSIVIALFVAQAIVFTVKAHDKDYLKDPVLREQYKDMIPAMIEKDFGPDAAQLGQQIRMRQKLLSVRWRRNILMSLPNCSAARISKRRVWHT